MEKNPNYTQNNVHIKVNNGPIFGGTSNFYGNPSQAQEEGNAEVVDCEDVEAEHEAGTSEEKDSEAAKKTIPQDCVAAAVKIITPQFKSPNETVLNSSAQIVKASTLIDLTSNSEVAMLMTICQELNAIAPGATCPDFVRVLIGLGVIDYTDNKAIDRMADGMTKKRNGYTRGSKTYPPLPAIHVRWKTSDRTIGDKIYNSMITQG